MNPFQFKSFIFSLASPTAVRVECLLLCCIDIVCWRTKNVYCSPFLLTAILSNEMKMGFHIMGKSENIGSNIIFSSALCHSKKAMKKKTAKRPLAQRIRASGRRKMKLHIAEGVKTEARTSTVYWTERRKNCLLGNSVVHIIPFRFYILFWWDL